jgi:hypothetical protein
MSGEYKFTTSSIRFSSSLTLLQNFFPLTNSSYQITTPGTVCEAIFSCTTYKYADATYSQFGLYIPGVEYVKKDGQVEKGTYVPIVFAAHASAGREDTVIDIIQTEAYYSIDLGDEGQQLATFWIGHYKEISPEDKDQPKNESLLCHRYENGNDTIGYAVRTSGPEETIEKTLIAERVEYGFEDLTAVRRNISSQLREMARRLKEIPMFKVVEAKLVTGTGRGNASAQRIE